MKLKKNCSAYEREEFVGRYCKIELIRLDLAHGHWSCNYETVIKKWSSKNKEATLFQLFKNFVTTTEPTIHLTISFPPTKVKSAWNSL